MWRLILLAVTQSLLLCGGQVMLKFALNRLDKFSWSFAFFWSLVKDFWFLGMGVCYILASILWIYILKKFPFSMAYPMISIGYIFGMLSAIIFFHEQVSLTRWLGVFMIMAGCCLIAK